MHKLVYKNANAERSEKLNNKKFNFYFNGNNFKEVLF